MDCAGVASHLVAYHFATVSDEERDAIDAHLLGCKACLEAYFALKRAADKRPLEKPSARVKDRLRAEVAATFPATKRTGARHAARAADPALSGALRSRGRGGDRARGAHAPARATAA